MYFEVSKISDYSDYSDYRLKLSALIPKNFVALLHRVFPTQFSSTILNNSLVCFVVLTSIHILGLLDSIKEITSAVLLKHGRNYRIAVVSN
jgi:hypothetical protein